MSNKKSKTTKEGHFYFTQDLKKKKLMMIFFSRILLPLPGDRKLDTPLLALN